MREPSFDIFSGRPGRDVVWLEAVGGLVNARARMEEIAAEKPGEYFIFSFGSHTVLAQIETFKKTDSAKANSA